MAKSGECKMFVYVCVWLVFSQVNLNNAMMDGTPIRETDEQHDRRREEVLADDDDDDEDGSE